MKMKKKFLSVIMSLVLFTSSLSNIPIRDVKALANTSVESAIGGQVLNLKFDGNTNDSSSAGNNATITGTESYVAGVNTADTTDKAINLNGSQYLNLGTNPNLQPSNLTCSFWIKPNGPMSGEEMILWNKTVWNSDGWYVTSANDSNPLQVSIGPAPNGNNQPLLVGVNSTNRNTFFPANTWTHIAITYDGTTHTLCIYRNGVKQQTSNVYSIDSASGATGAITGTSDQKSIGYNGPIYNGAYLNAALDNFQIYSNVATQDQVISLYEESGMTFDKSIMAQSDLDGLIVPTTATTVLALPTIGALGSTITWSSNNTVINVTTGAVTRPAAGQQDATVTLTATANYEGSTAQKAFTVTVPALTGGSTGSDVESAIGGQVLNLKFDGNTNDSSTAGNNATITGTESYVAGVNAADTKDKAINLNGSQYLNLGTNPNLQPPNLTCSFWIKPNGPMSGEEMILWNKTVWNSDGWYVTSANDSNPLQVSIGSATKGNNQPLLVGVNSTDRNTFFPANTWTHIAITYDGTTHTLCIYRNGVKQPTSNVYSIDSASGATGTITGTNDQKSIGYNGPNYKGSYLNAALDDFQIYSNVATQDQVISLYQESGLTFDGLSIPSFDLSNLSIPTTTTTDLPLPTTGVNGSTITWSSNSSAIDAATGKVTRPASGQPDATVTLTATASYKSYNPIRNFTVTVPALTSGSNGSGVESEIGGQVLNLKFEDNIIDSSAAGNNAAIVGNNYSYDTGVNSIGKALNLKGSTFLNLGNNPNLQPSNLTCSFWIKPNGSMSGEEMILWNKTVWYSDGWYVDSASDSNPLEVSIGPANTNKQPLMVRVNSTSRNTFFPADTWTHIAITYDGIAHSLCIYRNGVKQPTSNVYSIDAPSGATGTITGTNDQKSIGYNGPNYMGSYLNAALDNFQIYSNVATQDQVISLYQESGLTFDGSNIPSSDLMNLSIPSTTTADLTLPTTGANGSKITWSSNNTAIDVTTGKVTRPAVGQLDATVTLTASANYQNFTATQNFIITVPAQLLSTLTIDCSNVIRAVTHCADGSLYGVIESKPADVPNLVAPLNLHVLNNPAIAGPNYQQPIGAAIPVAQRVAPLGAKVQIRLADWFTGWYNFTNLTDWFDKITTTVNAVRTAGLTNIYGYEIWNEPFYSWHPDKTGMNFDNFYSQSQEKLKQLDPNAKAIGPSFEFYDHNAMHDFLTYQKAHNTIPDIICWHQLGPQDIVSDVNDYRALEASLGISPRPITLNEYSGPGWITDEGRPGAVAPLIAKFERVQIDSACQSFWDVPNPGRLGSLLANDTEKNGGWWFYNWYGQMSGNMVTTTPSASSGTTNLDGFSSVDANSKKLTVLFGGSDGKANVVINNIPSFIGTTANVKVECTPWIDKNTPVDSTNVISQHTYVVINGSITVSIDNMNPNYGYRVLVTPGSSSSILNRGIYKLENQNSCRVLGITNNSTENEASVVQNADTGNTDNEWRFDLQSDGYYKIINKNRGLVLGVVNSSTSINSQVEQENDISAASQEWKVTLITGNTYKIVNKNSGLALGISNMGYAYGASCADGANAIQKTDSVVVDEDWYFEFLAIAPNQDQAAPTGLIGVSPTSSANNNGKITGTTTAMEYKLSTAINYVPVTGIVITGLSAGTYNVRYAAKTGYNAGAVANVVVPSYVAPYSPPPVVIIQVDKTALNTAVTAATTLIGSKTVGTGVGNVAQSSKDAFQAAIDAAAVVNNNVNATQAQVDAQVAALMAATNAFNNSVITVDKTVMNKAITNAAALIGSKTVGSAVGNIPQTARDAFQAVINSAIAVRDNVNAAQAQVDAQATVLTAAIATLNNAVITVDKSALNTAITNATILISSITVGTDIENVPQSVKDSFQAVIDAAATQTNNETSTQAQIDEQVAILETATTTFNNAIIKEIPIDEAALANAQAAAKKELANKVAAQKEVQKAAIEKATANKAIKEAKTILMKVSSKKALKAAANILLYSAQAALNKASADEALAKAETEKALADLDLANAKINKIKAPTLIAKSLANKAVLLASIKVAAANKTLIVKKDAANYAANIVKQMAAQVAKAKKALESAKIIVKEQ